MRVRKSFFLLLTFVIVIATFAGCSGQKGVLDGKWAYIHDKETAALTIESGGKAVLDGVKYDCSYDDSFIALTDSASKTKKLRYFYSDETLVLYKQTDYTYSGEGTPANIYHPQEGE